MDVSRPYWICSVLLSLTSINTVWQKVWFVWVSVTERILVRTSTFQNADAEGWEENVNLRKMQMEFVLSCFTANVGGTVICLLTTFGVSGSIFHHSSEIFLHTFCFTLVSKTVACLNALHCTVAYKAASLQCVPRVPGASLNVLCSAVAWRHF